MNLNLPPINLSGGIKLTEIEATDYLDYYEIGKSENTTKYLNWGPFKNPNEALWIINEVFFHRPYEGLPVGYAIRYRNHMIGIIDFHTYYPNDNSCEIGYILHENYWGHGIMKRALKKMIEVGFYHLGYSKLVVGTIRENIQSERVIKACGFHYEYEKMVELKDGYHLGYYYTLYQNEVGELD